MLLRVILGPDNIRKVAIPQTPSTLEELKDILCEKLQIEKGFSLQYEDADFGNQLCNLVDVSELPADKATLKVFWDIAITPVESLAPVQDEADMSDFTLDTASQASSSSSSSCQRAEQWPAKFPIPSFSFDVEFRLQKGNEAYEKSKATQSVSREIKMEILDRVAEAIYSFKAYPTDCEFESVAAALVHKHPCLREPGSETGWQGWKMSLKYKMGNYRQKLRNAGCFEVQVNKKEKDKPQKGVKKPKRSEINFLPDHPTGVGEEQLEQERKAMEEEMKKKNINMTLISQKMDITFSMRRREIIYGEPPIATVTERWPGLFLEQQVYAEFKKITGVDLCETFYTSLDKYSGALIRMFRAKSDGQLKVLLDRLDAQTADIIKHKRVTALKGLPCYLREYTHMVKTCVGTEFSHIRGIKMAILEVSDARGETDPLGNLAVVIEETLALEGLGDFPTAFMVLFGLLYALNIEYPKEWRYTFETVQKVFLPLGEQCSARTLSLKNRLLKA